MEAGTKTKHTHKLREFSMQLAERLKAAPNTPVQPLRLAVRIGSESYLVDMATAGEIVTTTDIAPVPWTRPWYRGLTNVRGRLIGVVDLQELSGGTPLTPEQSQQVLVFGPALKVNAGVLISRAFGLRNIRELEELGATGNVALPWEMQRYRDLDGTVLTELDLPRLVAAEVFSSVGI
jgi:twitching motility protein PilI